MSEEKHLELSEEISRTKEIVEQLDRLLSDIKGEPTTAREDLKSGSLSLREVLDGGSSKLAQMRGESLKIIDEIHTALFVKTMEKVNHPIGKPAG